MLMVHDYRGMEIEICDYIAIRGVGGLEKVWGQELRAKRAAQKILGLLIIHKGAFSSRTV